MPADFDGLASIEWATHSLNPGIFGCQEYGPGCANCYAAAMAHRFPNLRGGHEGVTVKRASGVHWTGVVHTLPIGEAVAKVRGFKLGRNEGRPRVFVTSMADILHEKVEIGWMASLVRAMALRPEADWLLLTKRAHRWPELSKAVVEQLGAWPANVWASVSVEDQKRADERIPYLLRVPARVRFLSCEPLVGFVNLAAGLFTQPPAGEPDEGPEAGGMWRGPQALGDAGLQWVIAGGESGPHAQPSHPDWFRSMRDQCVAANVPFFFKQWGEWAPWHTVGLAEGMERCADGTDKRLNVAHSGRTGGNPHLPGDMTMYRLGKKAAGRLLDGIEHNEVPRG